MIKITHGSSTYTWLGPAPSADLLICGLLLKYVLGHVITTFILQNPSAFKDIHLAEPICGHLLGHVFFNIYLAEPVCGLLLDHVFFNINFADPVCGLLLNSIIWAAHCFNDQGFSCFNIIPYPRMASPLFNKYSPHC